jgi:signal transduction histidine kinase
MPAPARHRLATRFVVVFGAFVVVGSLVLLSWLRHQQRAEDERLFLTLARADADFVQKLNLPHSARLASDLGRLLGMQIHFRDASGALEPALDDAEAAPLKNLPPDQVSSIRDSWQALRLRLDERHDMLFIRRVPEAALSLWHPATRNALITFWLLSAALGWVIARQVVRPVQRLTRTLPALFDKPDLTPTEVTRHDEIGALARALTQARDDLLTEREKRAQSERMALLGRVATGLAHEIKNPLASIQLHAQLVDACTLDEESVRSLQHVRSEAQVIEGLVNQWLYLTRPVPPKKEPVDLHALLQEMLAALLPQARHASVSFEMHPITASLQVSGDRPRLQQALRNIILNAIQAMPRGGLLKIESGHTREGITLSFEDSGSGFSEKALAHASELFFSEKEGGMGVGLNVTHEIITAHGGTLRLSNTREGGACVQVMLPA